jgi:hypothetical protein
VLAFHDEHGTRLDALSLREREVLETSPAS